MLEKFPQISWKFPWKLGRGKGNFHAGNTTTSAWKCTFVPISKPCRALGSYERRSLEMQSRAIGLANSVLPDPYRKQRKQQRQRARFCTRSLLTNILRKPSKLTSLSGHKLPSSVLIGARGSDHVPRSPGYRLKDLFT